MHKLRFVPPVRLSMLLAGIVFTTLIFAPGVRAQDAKPRHKPDAKAWKAAREQGQKALEEKKFAQSEQLFTAALDEARNFAPDDYRLAESLGDLALAHCARGNFAAAEPLCQEAAKIRHGDPNPLIEADVVFTLGWVSERLGHLDEAGKAYQRTEEIMSRKFGPNDPQTIICTFRRGMIYYKQQDFAQAEPLLKHSFTQFRNPSSKITFHKGEPAAYGMQAIRHIYRPNYAYALEAASRLSQIYLLQNKLPDAEKCMKDALDLVDEYAGKSDPEIPNVLKELSDFYFEINNAKAAEPVLQRLAVYQEKNLGPGNEATITTDERLAAIYAQENKTAQAQALYEKVISLREAATGPDSRETAVAVANLGKFYVTHEEYAKAEPLYRRQLEQTIKYQGEGIALTPVLADQAVIYSKLGRDADLEAVYKRQISTCEKMFGPNTPALVKPLTDCAQILRKQNRAAEAEAMENRANELRAALKK